MALGSVAARNAVLDSSLSGTNAPANLYVALFVGDPAGAGTEVTGGGGYARQILPKTSWASATGGSKATSAVINFPTVTAPAWGSITHVAFFDALTAGNRWDMGPLTLGVNGSVGTTISFAIGNLVVTEA